MSSEFADNPSYVQCEMLLKEVHRLIGEGKGDTDEADFIRDSMEEPEQGITPTEGARLRGLSADLYMLQDDEIYEPYEGTQEELRLRLNDAWEQGRYEAVLALLRKGTPFLTPERVAYLRGRCYAALGHLETALLFLRYAAERDPERAAYRVAVLDLLLKLHRADDALAEAASYLKATAEPLLLAV